MRWPNTQSLATEGHGSDTEATRKKTRTILCLFRAFPCPSVAKDWFFASLVDEALRHRFFEGFFGRIGDLHEHQGQLGQIG